MYKNSANQKIVQKEAKMSKCPLCENEKSTPLFTKESKFQQKYTIVKCRRCGSEFIDPMPREEELLQYYDKSYFLTRKDRGYNNYFNSDTKKQIASVFRMNLLDSDFGVIFSKSALSKRSLDIGCAAGYFVEIMQNSNFEAEGIDVSHECTLFAREELKLNVKEGNYLSTSYNNKFGLITLWATIEHLNNPHEFIKKIHQDLEDNGILIISTCRSDSLFKKIHGKKWRYYNVPEHVFYPTVKGLKILLAKYGFNVKQHFTYGSGFAAGGSFFRKIADILAKKCGMGDMIVITAQKEENQ
jgi:2-polyprenyl-3-methyl-5-hydroxy-6-metoxy-1,4-benzoquinol methylase